MSTRTQDGGLRVLRHLRKPWYLYRPSQLFRRIGVSLSPPTPGYRPLRTSWGVSLLADATKTIGENILATGVYDLVVSEALARLTPPGATVVDVGANVGYMTLLAAAAAGPDGRVLAFEPHPELFGIAQKNYAAAREHAQLATVTLHNTAVGERAYAATLIVPDFEGNDGLSRVSTGPAGARDTSIQVTVQPLDDVIAGGYVDVMKVDVEGFERQVFEGAARALADQRIAHIIFEDHNILASPVVNMLRGAGYQIHALGLQTNGLTLTPLRDGEPPPQPDGLEVPNFLATAKPDEALRRCSSRGWRVLSTLARTS